MKSAETVGPYNTVPVTVNTQTHTHTPLRQGCGSADQLNCGADR